MCVLFVFVTGIIVCLHMVIFRMFSSLQGNMFLLGYIHSRCIIMNILLLNLLSHYRHVTMYSKRKQAKKIYILLIVRETIEFCDSLICLQHYALDYCFQLLFNFCFCHDFAHAFFEVTYVNIILISRSIL